LDAEAFSRIEQKLRAHEEKTSDQVVVATLPSLQGYPIEEFANGLFRAWKLGDKAKNNGVLLIVAPNERKVRIEVGYGLEGALTDALSKVIITTAVAPNSRTAISRAESRAASMRSSRSWRAMPRNGSGAPRFAATNPPGPRPPR
jgi:uncharacterized membrane protein YgcG